MDQALYLKIRTLKIKTRELALQNMNNWENESRKLLPKNPRKKDRTDKWIAVLNPPPPDPRIPILQMKMEKNNRKLLSIMDQLNSIQDELTVLLMEERK